MANTPHLHELGSLDQQISPSLDSRLEVGGRGVANDVEASTNIPDIQVAFRMIETGIHSRGIHLVLPQVDRGAHPLLIAQSFKSPLFGEEVDLRRVIITHEADDVVVARNWLVNVDTGGTLAVDSHSRKGARRTEDSGPLIRNLINFSKLNPQAAQGELVLQEGVAHHELLKTVYPEQLEESGELHDFLTETRPFIGGQHIALNLFGSLVLRHNIHP